MTEIVDTKLKKIWSDFTVKDTVSYSTVLDTASVNASEKAKTMALGFLVCTVVGMAKHMVKEVIPKV